MIKQMISAIVWKLSNNVLISAIYSLFSFFSIPVWKKERERHLEKNSNTLKAERLVNENEYIENQQALEKLLFGKGRNPFLSYSGCGIIAIFNALLNLGDDNRFLPGLISSFEKRGAVLRGRLGIAPSALYKYLKKQGFKVKRTTSRKAEKISILGDEFETFIVTFFWNKKNIFDKIHTVNISKKDGEFFIHNNYNHVDGVGFLPLGPYKDLGSAIENLGENTAPIVIIGAKNA